MIPLDTKRCATCGVPPRPDTAGTLHKVACQFVQCEPELEIPWFHRLDLALDFWNEIAFDANNKEITQRYRPTGTSPVFETKNYRLDPVGFTVIRKHRPEENARIPFKIRRAAAVVINALDFLQNGRPQGERLPSALWDEAINAYCEILFAANNQIENDCEDLFTLKPTKSIPPPTEQTPRSAA